MKKDVLKTTVEKDNNYVFLELKGDIWGYNFVRKVAEN